MSYSRPHLRQNLGQFEWLDSGAGTDWLGDTSLDELDLGDSFDYGALDLGGDINLADYGGAYADDYAVDYGSGSFADWGSADWGADLSSDPGAFDAYSADSGFDWSFADTSYGRR